MELQATTIIFYVAILVFSVILHELAHGYAALWRGDPTAKYAGRLTLNPASHLDPIGSLIVPLVGYLLGGFIIGWAKPVPYNPYNLRKPRLDEFLIAVAGPVTNLVIAIVSTALLALVVQIEGSLGGFARPMADFLLISLSLNISLAVFNLIPIPPLDGSKILFSILPPAVSYKVRGVLEQYGFMLVLILIFLFSSVIGFVASTLIRFLLSFVA
jgi:Zn-dependent protease